MTTLADYPTWLSQVAQQYLIHPAAFGDSSALANSAGNQQKFLGELQSQPGMQDIYNRGITPDQLVNTQGTQDNEVLQHANAWHQSGTGPMPDDVAAALAAGKLIAPSEGGNSDYAWNPQNDPLNLGGSIATYDPFNKGIYNDTSQVAFAPNVGLVTSTANQKQSIMDQLGPGPLMGLLWGGMMSAGLSAAGSGALANAGGAGGGSLLSPSTIFKLPGIAQAADNGGGTGGTLASLASAFLPGASSAAGLPSATPTLANLALTLARGGSPFSALLGLATRLSPNITGGP